MAGRLFVSVAKNDKRTFLGLVQQKRALLQEKLHANQNTILHFAARCERAEFVSEIIKLCPEMVAAENVQGETALHEACRKGNADIAMILLENNPWAASTLNKYNQSAFSIACRRGHVEVVKLLLNQSWLMDIEEDRIDFTCLREAISRGHIRIVKTLLEVRPGFAHKIDKSGSNPLHYACQEGQFEIASVLLESSQDLSQQMNKSGYTSLHLAAMTGAVPILLDFMSKAPSAFKLLTKDGETVFHLAVKSGKYDAFISMAKIFKNTNILHHSDQYGNTVLHLAIYKESYNLSEYIINETTVDINHKNHQGLRALDLLNQAEGTPEARHIIDTLVKSGCQRTPEMSLPEFNSPILTPESHVHTLEEQFEMQPASMKDSENAICNHPNDPPNLQDAETSPEDNTIHQIERKLAIQTDIPNQRSLNRTSLEQHKHQSHKHRKELCELHKSRRNKQYETYREGLLNARNTIMLVAVLIATVTFTGGLNPPGGFHQDGDLRGQSTVGRKLAFKIFVISNSMALFASLCIVIVLVSIIPFQRKKLLRLMKITHKIMWLAMICMATAYVAATWVILPNAHNIRWIFEAIMVIGGGTMTAVFFFLGLQLVRHWMRKSKWKKEKRNKIKIAPAIADIETGSQISKSVTEGEIQQQQVQYNNEGEIKSESTNSDVDSSKSFGYHTY